MGKSFHNKVQTITTSDFAKNSAKLLSANIFAQAIGLLVYPLLTRLYSADDFGLFSLFVSIGGVIVLFATAEYQYAIMLPKSEKKATACFQIGFFINILVTILCLLSIPFATSIAHLFNAPELANWYYLLPFFIFLSAFWVLLNYWYTRHKNFTNIGSYQLTQSLFSAGAKYGFGMAGFTSGGLLISTVLAPALSIIISISASFKKVLKPLLIFDKQECKMAAKEFSNFPKFSLPRSIINNFSGNLPVLLLTPFFGLIEIGFWGMALTLAFRPINMISGSLYQVFFQRTAERVQNKQSIMPFFKKFILNTLLLLIPIFTVLYFVLPWLTEWLLGNGWHVTGEYIRIMLPWLTMSAFVAPICFLSDIFLKQKTGLLFEMLLIIFRLIGLVMGLLTDDFKIALIGYCIGSTLIIFAQFIWYISLIAHYEKKILTNSIS